MKDNLRSTGMEPVPLRIYDRKTVIPVLYELFPTLDISVDHIQESIDAIKTVLEKTNFPQPKSRNSKLVLIGGGSGTPVVGRSLYASGVTDFTMIASSGEMSRNMETRELNGEGTIYEEIPTAVDNKDTVKQAIFATPDDNKNEVHKLLSSRRGKTNFGYLIFEALRQMTDDPQMAIDYMTEWMDTPYRVVPSTTDRTKLSFIFDGQPTSSIDYIKRERPEQFADEIILEPKPTFSKTAEAAIKEAETIIVGPGDAYLSVLPHWSIGGLQQTIESNTNANIVLVVNLTWREIDTYHFKVSDFLNLYSKFLPKGKTITALVNTSEIPYDNQTMDDIEGDTYGNFKIVRADIAGIEFNRNNQLTHDQEKFGRALRQILESADR